MRFEMTLTGEKFISRFNQALKSYVHTQCYHSFDFVYSKHKSKALVTKQKLIQQLNATFIIQQSLPLVFVLMFEGCVAPIPSLVIGGAVQKSIVVLIMNAVASFAGQPVRLIFNTNAMSCRLNALSHGKGMIHLSTPVIPDSMNQNCHFLDFCLIQQICNFVLGGPRLDGWVGNKTFHRKLCRAIKLSP